MKRIIFVVFLFITLVWGCKESPLDPIIIEDPVKVTFNAIVIGVNGIIDPAGESKVKFGDSKIYKVIPNDGYSPIVTIDGVAQILYSDNTLEVKADVLSGKEIKAEFVSNNTSLVISSSWFFEKIERQDSINAPWNLLVPDSRLSGTYWVFSLTGYISKFDPNGSTYGGPYKWNFTEKGINIGSQTYLSITVDKDKLVLVYFSHLMGSSDPNEGVLIRETYIHK